jgi:asparagine synthase (glutamine-hydrolysing)
MCGFLVHSGCYNNNIKIELLNSLKLTNHRGPDKSDFKIIDEVFLGFNWLAIQDSNPKAMQPFFINKEKQGIVFNGEIYNHRQLREELINDNIRFETDSDTEVLINGYKIWGLDILLKKIKGMYSFVILDRDINKIFAVRDKFGIKPLYYYIGKNLILSSEIKSILPLIPQKNFNKSTCLLSMFTTYENLEETIFENIYEILPGQILEYEFKNQHIKKIKYFDIKKLVNKNKYNDLNKKSSEEILEMFDYLFNQSISNHLVAELPAAVSLSGGLDSSVVAKSVYGKNKKLKSFFFSSNSNLSNKDLYYIELLKRTMNDIEIVSEENNKSNFLDDLQNLLYFYERPGKPEGIVLSRLTKHAKNLGYKFLLVGDGADELFGGYEYHSEFYKKTLAQQSYFKKIFKILNKVLPTGVYDLQLFEPYKFDYLNYPSNKNLFEVPFNLLFHKGNNLKSWKESLEAYSFLSSKFDSAIQSFLIDGLSYQLPRYLHRSDRYGMMNSLELRTPFLDEDLVEFILNLNLKYKMKYDLFTNSISRKFLLKKYATMIKVPKEIVNRRKIGTDFIYIDKLKKIILDLSFDYTEEILGIKKEVIKYNLLNSFDPNIDRVQYGFVSMEILGKLFIKK